MNAHDPLRHVLDHLAPDEEYSLQDWIAAGDTSIHGHESNQIVCVAVAALPHVRMAQLESNLRYIFAHHLGRPAAGDIEIHAKDLWNGSARQRGPFSSLRSKKLMQELVIDICLAIRAQQPVFCVTAGHLNSLDHNDFKKDFADSNKVVGFKKYLVAHTTMRVNDMLKLSTGKHVGQMPLLFDRESRPLFEKRGPAGSIGVGPYIEMALSEPTDPTQESQVIRSLGHRFSEEDSRVARLIQVADISCYFVGKYLSDININGDVSTSQNKSVTLGKSNSDIEFFRRIWDLLNLEVEVAVHRSQVPRRPGWLRSVGHAYESMFEIFGKESTDTSFSIILRDALARRPYRFDYRRFSESVRSDGADISDFVWRGQRNS